MTSSSQSNVSFSTWNLKKVAGVIIFILVFGTAYYYRKQVPEIVQGRYIPFVGVHYTFPGKINPANDKSTKEALKTFDESWGMVIIATDKAENKQDEKLKQAKSVFLKTLKLDTTLRQIAENIVNLLPLEEQDKEEAQYHFEVLNLYFREAGYPLRLDFEVGRKRIADGEWEIFFLPTVLREEGWLKMKAGDSWLELMLVAKHDHLNIFSRASGMAKMDRKEAWLLISDIQWQEEIRLSQLMVKPALYLISNDEKYDFRLSQKLGAWIYNNYSKDGKIERDKYIYDWIKSVAIHETRHLSDSEKEYELTLEGINRFSNIDGDFFKSVILEVRAYLTQLAEGGPESAKVIADLSEHLYGRASGKRELYGVVAFHVLALVSEFKGKESEANAKLLLDKIAEEIPIEQEQLNKRARRAYEDIFDEYTKVSIEGGLVNAKETAKWLAGEIKPERCSDNANILNRAGKAAANEKRHDIAKKLWMFVLKACPEALNTRELLVNRLIEEKDWPGVVESTNFDKLYMMNKTTYFNRGLALWKTGRKDEAIKVYEYLIKNSRKYKKESNRNLAILLIDKNNKKEALKHFAAACRMGCQNSCKAMKKYSGK